MEYNKLNMEFLPHTKDTWVSFPHKNYGKDNPEDKPTTEYPDFMTKEDIEFCEKAKRGEIVFKKYDDPHQPIIYI